MKTAILFLSSTLLSLGAVNFAAKAQVPTQASTSVASPASQGTLIHDPAAMKWEARGSGKKFDVIEAATPSGRAISARIKKRRKQPWDIALWLEMRDGVKKGDEVEINFWARTAKAPKGYDTGSIIVFVGRNQEPFDYIISEEFFPGPEWKMHTLRGIAQTDYAAGKIKAEYQLAKRKQTVEFGSMYVKNLGQ